MSGDGISDRAKTLLRRCFLGPVGVYSEIDVTISGKPAVTNAPDMLSFTFKANMEFGGGGEWTTKTVSVKMYDCEIHTAKGCTTRDMFYSPACDTARTLSEMGFADGALYGHPTCHITGGPGDDGIFHVCVVRDVTPTDPSTPPVTAPATPDAKVCNLLVTYLRTCATFRGGIRVWNTAGGVVVTPDLSMGGVPDRLAARHHTVSVDRVAVLRLLVMTAMYHVNEKVVWDDTIWDTFGGNDVAICETLGTYGGVVALFAHVLTKGRTVALDTLLLEHARTYANAYLHMASILGGQSVTCFDIVRNLLRCVIDQHKPQSAADIAVQRLSAVASTASSKFKSFTGFGTHAPTSTPIYATLPTFA